MIEFESVSKTFRDGTSAVSDLSLSIPSDKITVIVGPSGCGKTTTLRMINRMLEPSKGRITWDGTPLRSRRKTTLRRQMGYVIQSGGLFPHRTVVENIGTVPGLLGWSKDKTRKRSMELLTNVGLDRAMAGRYPAQLSGGQQQRVGVARALAADPLVMLMDEPFSAVDPVVRAELHEFFLGLQRQISKTIVLITHDIDEAIKLGDQVVILRVGGRLAQAGPPQQLLDEPADAFVEGFVGRDRGYRSLSFLPAAGLRLQDVAVVRDATAGGAGGPTLVLDGEARPVGWLDHERPGLVHAIGATFVREDDTLRAALDSALTSPYGLAVALDPETGRYAGVVPADQILAQVTARRTESSEPVTLAAAEAWRQQSADAPSAGTEGSGAAAAQQGSDPSEAETALVPGAADDETRVEEPAQDPSSEAERQDEPADEPATGLDAQPDGDPAVEQQLGPGGATALALGAPLDGGHPEQASDAAEDGPRQERESQPGGEPHPDEQEQPTMIREQPFPLDGPPSPHEHQAPAPDEHAAPEPPRSAIYSQPRSLPHDAGGSRG